MRRTTTIAAISTLLAVGAGGCFTTTADFADDAPKFIADRKGLRSAECADTGTRLRVATCAEPPDQEEGTTFTCSATDSNGAVWEFEILITGSSDYEVNISRRPAGS